MAKHEAGVLERIRRAALDCFSENGYAGTSVADIARRAGTSPASLYRFYPGKRELFDSLERPDLDKPSPKTEERRKQIVMAGLKVFSEKGFAGTTMDDVAQAAGISKAAIYGYFDGKEQLFAAVVGESPQMMQLEGLRSELLAGHPGADPEAVLRQFALVVLRLFQEPARLDLFRIILAEGARNPAASTLYVSSTVRRGAKALAAILERLGFTGGEELVETAQAWIGTLFSWVVLNRLLLRPDDAPDLSRSEAEMADRAVRMLLYGLTRNQG